MYSIRLVYIKVLYRSFEFFFQIRSTPMLRPFSRFYLVYTPQKFEWKCTERNNNLGFMLKNKLPKQLYFCIYFRSPPIQCIRNHFSLANNTPYENISCIYSFM